MAKDKFDGVVEAVHYDSGGGVKWARVYLRRGPIFSDRLKLDRQTLIDQLKAGKRFFTGRQIPLMAGTFELSKPVKLFQTDGREVLVAGDTQATQDFLDGAPVI